METKLSLEIVVYDHDRLRTRLYLACSHLIVNSIHQIYRMVVSVMRRLVMLRVLIVMGLH